MPECGGQIAGRDVHAGRLVRSRPVHPGRGRLRGHPTSGVDDLPAARALLHRHLVSREADDLTASEVSGATIESVAENASDSVVAPLFFFACFGLPGAGGVRRTVRIGSDSSVDFGCVDAL